MKRLCERDGVDQRCKLAVEKGVVAPLGLEDFLTPLGLTCDLPSMDGVDYLSHPRDVIASRR